MATEKLCVQSTYTKCIDKLSPSIKGFCPQTSLPVPYVRDISATTDQEYSVLL